MTNLSKADASRVFISYVIGPMTAPARALRSALERYGVDPWSVHADVPAGVSWEESIDQAIRSADAFVILIAPGDEQNRWLSFETRHILTRVWSGNEAQVSVLAPAVRAIPSALRHQDFVSYFAHDEIQLSRWAVDSSVVDVFVEEWLRASRRPRLATPPPTDDEFAPWRNAVVHVGRGPGRDAAERQRVLDSIRGELDRGDWTASDALPSARLDAALERAVLAQHLDDNELALKYFSLASAAVPDAQERADPTVQYPAGLAALGAGDTVGAAELFRRAASLYESRHGARDPRSIAALYNLGLALSMSGDDSGAVEAYRAALDRSRSALGPHHPQTASVAFNLAQLLARAGAAAEAIPLLEAAEEAYETVTPADSPELAAVRLELTRLRP